MSFGDDFNRADSTDLGPGWVETFTDTGYAEILSNILRMNSSGDTDDKVYILASQPVSDTPNMQVVGTQRAWGGATSHDGLIARSDGVDPIVGTYYMASYARGAGPVGYRLCWSIRRVEAGSTTYLSWVSHPIPEDGDVVRFHVLGTTLKLYVNEIEVLTATDDVISVGEYAGIGFQNWLAGNRIREWDDFFAGPLPLSRKESTSSYDDTKVTKQKDPYRTSVSYQDARTSKSKMGPLSSTVEGTK